MKKSRKLNSLDKQFFNFIVDYQQSLDKNDPKRYSIQDIIQYAQSRDVSLKRKPQLNLIKSCEVGKFYIYTSIGIFKRN